MHHRGLQHLDLARHRFTGPRHGLERVPLIRIEVGEHVEQDHARRAIDRGVVGLGQHRPSSVGEPLDDVALPQRARAVHVPTDDPRHLLGELVGRPGRRQTEMPNVVVEIEVRVVDPVGMIELHRHGHEAPPHGFEPTDHPLEPTVDEIERIEVRRRPLVDGEPADMAHHRGGLHVEKARVEPTELLHDPYPQAEIFAVVDLPTVEPVRGIEGVTVSERTEGWAVRSSQGEVGGQVGRVEARRAHDHGPLDVDRSEVIEVFGRARRVGRGPDRAAR